MAYVEQQPINSSEGHTSAAPALKAKVEAGSVWEALANHEHPFFEDTLDEHHHRHQSNETFEEDIKVLASGDKSSIDPNAPFPTPLHTIEAILGQTDAKLGTTKRSKLTWELSDLDGNEGLDLVRYQELDFDDEDPYICTPAQGFTSPGVEAPIVAGWLQGIATPPTASSLNKGSQAPNTISHRCDIDTTTGEFLPVVTYPETQKTHLDGPSRNMDDIAWRQANLTSELRIQRELQVRRALAERIRASMQQQVQEERPSPEEVAWPEAHCLIRPAVAADFPGIALIMNLESHQAKPQLVESRTLGVEDVEFAFNYCRRELRPFLVAVPGEPELLDRAKWPKGAEADKDFNEYVQFKQAQAQKSKAPPVLGFAFITEPRMGPLGGYCFGSRYSGLIKLFVHPDHRRKLYGSALLDRVLLSVAVYHRSVVDHKWECPNSASIYETPAARNSRKYARLYLETLFSGPEDPEIQWIGKLLEDTFEFKRTGYFAEALRTGSDSKSQWLDLAIWEHHARPIAEIME
ncbi:Fc.00g108760.m01.CDS01 [Cosmosporella sp. VM-42]